MKLVSAKCRNGSISFQHEQKEETMHEYHEDGMSHYHFRPVDTGWVRSRSRIEEDGLKVRLDDECEGVEVFLHLDAEAAKNLRQTLSNYEESFLQEENNL